jgi:hypothetical protein
VTPIRPSCSCYSRRSREGAPSRYWEEPSTTPAPYLHSRHGEGKGLLSTPLSPSHWGRTLSSHHTLEEGGWGCTNSPIPRQPLGGGWGYTILPPLVTCPPDTGGGRGGGGGRPPAPHVLLPLKIEGGREGSSIRKSPPLHPYNTPPPPGTGGGGGPLLSPPRHWGRWEVNRLPISHQPPRGTKPPNLSSLPPLPRHWGRVGAQPPPTSSATGEKGEGEGRTHHPPTSHWWGEGELLPAPHDLEGRGWGAETPKQQLGRAPNITTSYPHT